MRKLWLLALLAFSLVTGGWILVQDREGDGGDLTAALVQGAGGALGGSSEPAASGADDAKPVFYRYTDDSGSVRFVASLAEVPKHLREDAEPVSNDRVLRVPAAASRTARAAGRQAAAAPERAVASQKDVIVYTTSWCGWCRKTLAFLDEQGIDYENRDIEADDAWREELEEKTGSTSIPVVEIEGELVRGYDPARIRQLLEAS
jgi:glutaredoxin